MPATPTHDEENAARAAGYALIAGTDEVGCGCWAGPVYAAAVILPIDWQFPKVRDSKTLSPKQRAELAMVIKEAAVAWAIGQASVEEVDRLNIRRAAGLAMRRAVEALTPQPDFILVDAFRVPDTAIPQKGIIKGDAKSMSIAAASIVAKVERDTLLEKLALAYPGYGFENHKGYGTKEHQAGLVTHGICAMHRKSYEPIKKYLVAASDQRSVNGEQNIA